LLACRWRSLYRHRHENRHSVRPSWTSQFNRIRQIAVVAAATEHEDPAQLDDILAEVAETAVMAGTYGTIRKVTLELDGSAVLAML